MSSVDVFQISALALVVISVIQMVWAARKPVGWDPPRARPVRYSSHSEPLPGHGRGRNCGWASTAKHPALVGQPLDVTDVVVLTIYGLAFVAILA